MENFCELRCSIRAQVSSVTSRLLLCLPPLTSCPLSLFPPCLLYIDQLVVGGGTGAGGDHVVKRRPACRSVLSPSLSFIEPGREAPVGRPDGRTETNGQELPSLSLQHSIADGPLACSQRGESSSCFHSVRLTTDPGTVSRLSAVFRTRLSVCVTCRRLSVRSVTGNVSHLLASPVRVCLRGELRHQVEGGGTVSPGTFFKSFLKVEETRRRFFNVPEAPRGLVHPTALIPTHRAGGGEMFLRVYVRTQGK